jgi:hypothetical protein
MAGACPGPPTSAGNGQVARIPVAAGTQYYFTDALLTGFDYFQRPSGWFPDILQSSNSVNPRHRVVDMAYTGGGTATFFNVTAPTSSPYIYRQATRAGFPALAL